jgi:hypothetical protein
VPQAVELLEWRRSARLWIVDGAEINCPASRATIEEPEAMRWTRYSARPLLPTIWSTVCPVFVSLQLNKMTYYISAVMSNPFQAVTSPQGGGDPRRDEVKHNGFHAEELLEVE